MQSQSELTLFIFLTVLLLLVPTVIIIVSSRLSKQRLAYNESKLMRLEHEKQIEGYRLVVETEERERDIIAKNLHDGIIPNLCAIQSNLEMRKKFIFDKIVKQKLQDDIAAMSKIITELRGVTHDIAPPSILKYGLLVTLEDYIDYLDSGQSRIGFENNSNFSDVIPFTLTEQNYIYKICLELIQNLSKYANYNFLKISVNIDITNLLIEFVHDGKGVTNEEIEDLTNFTKSLGLRSLKSRAILLNAEIHYSYNHETACVLLRVPFKP